MYEPAAKSQLKKIQKIWQREVHKKADAEEAQVKFFFFSRALILLWVKVFGLLLGFSNELQEPLGQL